MLLKSPRSSTEFPVHLQVTTRKLFEIQTISEKKTTTGNEAHVILDSRSGDLGFWCLQRLCGWKSHLPPKKASPFFKAKLELLSTERGRKINKPKRNPSPLMKVGG